MASSEIVYSYSRISKYESCPRAYKYKYIDGETGWFDSIEGFMGSRVHEAVQLIYQRRKLGRSTSLEDMLVEYEVQWLRHWQTAERPVRVVRTGRGETEQHYYELGLQMLITCYDHLVYDLRNTTGIEVKVSGEFGGYPFVGYVDRVAGARPRFTLIDYKTGKNLPEEFIGKEAEQLRTYAALIMKAHDEIAAVDLELDFLRHNVQLSATVDRTELPKIEKNIISRIEAANQPRYPTRASALCSWCEYNDRCPGPKKDSKSASPF